LPALARKAESATPAGPITFNNFIVSDYYWTSSTDAADITQAWTIYICDFGVYNIAWVFRSIVTSDSGLS
jgi:hypothetical protein